MEMEKKLTTTENTKKIAVELKNITFSYGGVSSREFALDNLNVQIFEGEYVVVIGGNGSGKSTFGKVVTGIVTPQSGLIKIFEKTVKSYNQDVLMRNVGIVFQNPDDQFIGTTVKNDIIFGLENIMFDPKKMDEATERFIREVIKKPKNMDEKTYNKFIKNFLSYGPTRISGGQKQQVAIVSTLALSPRIIIFDESTTMLDPSGKKTVNNIIRGLKGKKTVISITHDMNEVIYADRVLVLHEGKVVFFEKPLSLFQKHSELLKIKLDLPFILKIALGLIEKGCKIVPTFEEKNLVKQLCQLL